MTKNTLPKFLIGAGVLLFIFELLNFNYDAPTDGELISFLLRLLVPILIIVSMWISIRRNNKEKG